jgi:hypothetical protein
MSQDQLAIFLPENRAAFRPREVLAVTLMWAFDDVPQRIDVRLFWRTQGKGTEDVNVVRQVPVSSTTAAGEQVINLPLPDEPWSFSGKLISLSWGAEVVVMPGGQNARCEFVLGPNGQEILLPSIE